METMEQFEKELDTSFRKIEEGDIIKGTIIDVSVDGAIVDLKYYAQGIIKADNFSDDPNFSLLEQVKVGDEISATVLSMDDGEGNILLSKKEAKKQEAWDKLQTYLEEETILPLKVAGIVPKGVIVYVEEIRGFIPASQLSLSYVEDLNDWLQKNIEAKVITVDKEKKRLVLSSRAVEEIKKADEQKKKIANLIPGTVVEGVVESIMPYGAFVNIGDGLTGLVHVSQICQKRIKTPAEVVAVNDKVKVKILKTDGDKISLSMKAIEEEKAAKEAVETFDYKETGKASTSLSDLLAGFKFN
ncbi:MAG: S1 RNA-binding domain-containing protein [Lachnospiraceae bacterium]